MGSTTPITAVEQLAGLQTRASGPVIQQILTEAQANIAAITASKTYEATERGLVNSVGGAIDFPVNYRLMELLPYWTDPGIGQYSTFGMWLSLDAYNSLPNDLRTIVDDVSFELNGGAGTKAFNDVAVGQCQEMLDAPTVRNLSAWSPEATKDWTDKIGSSAEQTWLNFASDYSIEDPAALLEQYKAGLERHSAEKYEDATLDCVSQFANR